MQTQHKVEMDKHDCKFGLVERVMQAVTGTDLMDRLYFHWVSSHNLILKVIRSFVWMLVREDKPT
jgi:hypothetical protein